MGARSVGIGLNELRRRSKPGECPFCGDPIPAKKPGQRGRRRKLCGDPACRTAYFRLWRRDERSEGAKVAVCNTRPSTVTSDQIGGRE